MSTDCVTPPEQFITVRGAREHNLKNIDLEIPRDRLVVVTGLSGSGKSSLAFDTVYAEGQRRYMESLSAYARQYMGMLERPDVDQIDGLSPVIAIEQKTVSRNPRSTVGTVTEVYDFLRLLYARAATSYSAVSGKPLTRQSAEEITEALLSYPAGSAFAILAPVVKARKGHYRDLFEKISSQGFTRVRVDGRMLEITPRMQLERYKTHDVEVVIDRIRLEGDVTERVTQSVHTALEMGDGVLFLALPNEKLRVFSRHLYDPETGESYAEASPNTFSFNSAYGACAACRGLGESESWVESLIIPDRGLSIAEGAIAPIGKPKSGALVFSFLAAVLKKHNCSFSTPLNELPPEAWEEVLFGSRVNYQITLPGSTYKYEAPFRGLYGHLDHEYTTAGKARARRLQQLRARAKCQKCKGTRLKDEARSYRIGDRTIADLADMDLFALRGFLKTVHFGQRQAVIAAPILKEIHERVSFMIDVGVGYLKLNRPAATLSGGESQRIRLATQIGTQLTGVLYVLDEPSIGLHARDNRKLIGSLRQLRDLGNSVLVVEHDRDMIEAADYVIDLGPGAGEQGGYLVCAGAPAELRNEDHTYISLTAQYLTGSRSIEIPHYRRDADSDRVVLTGARGHNLKNVDLELPLGLFICVTGVSGSGKSSLINQTLYPAISKLISRGAADPPLPHHEVRGYRQVSKVIDIDQKPIGRTPRSNPATYINLFTPIRDLFAHLPESKLRGYKPGRFSFNVPGGRCETCSGAGIMRLEMNFLPDVYVECETCDGRRYNAETLEVVFKGKTIADVLDLRVDEAAEFFASIPKIARKLETLQSVGLGYLRLGQQSTTISGGEAQRVKLSKELSRPGRGDTLYLLDEPTTGLHFEDIRHLLAVLQALVDKGNTVLVIEHNPDVIKVADYIVDMGPEGGDRGGEILYAGTPEGLAKQDTYTGALLREIFERECAPAF